MRLWTHVAGGEALWMLSLAVGGGPADPFSFAFAALGACLPDIDTEGSYIGRLFPFSRYLEERFGHRTVTHSLLGLGALGLFSLPLWLLLGHFQWWLALQVGCLSHLILDMSTVEGIELFWPHTGRAVFPGRDDLRLDQGSPSAARAEKVVLVSLLAFSGILWPLAQVGITGALRRAIGGIEATLPEYRELCPEYALKLSGTLRARLSGEVFQGEFPIAGTHGDGYVIAVEGVLYSVGEGEGYDLLPEGKVRLVRGPPRQETAFRVDLSGRLLGDLLPHLVGEHYVFGTLELEEGISPPIYPDRWNPIRGSSTVTLEYARLGDILPFADVGVRSGSVLVRCRGEASAPPVPSVPLVRPIVLKLRVASLSDLFVEEGDRVEEGAPLCAIATPELLGAYGQLAQAREVGGILGMALEWLAGWNLQGLRRKSFFPSPVAGEVTRVEAKEGNEDGLTVLVRIRPDTAGDEASGFTAPSGAGKALHGATASTGASTLCEVEPYFVSPRVDHVIKRILLGLIDSARETMDIAIYSFTDDDLGRAVVQAHRRGVAVRVIMDTSQRKARGGEYERLVNAGIPVIVEEVSGLMHHKFMVIDGEVVVTGSYNWSRSADDRNFENAVVIRDPEVAEAFEEEFERLWEALSKGGVP